MIATLWGIGQWEDADGVRQPWEISTAEIERDAAAAAHALETIGTGPGDQLLWCSMLSEAGQFWPWILGTIMRGAQVSCADATAGEANRVAMFCRLMRYHAVLGLNAAILDGLDDLGIPYRDLLAGVAVVGARPDAYDRLVAAGLTPHHFVLAGPAVALGAEPGGAAGLDTREWEADDDRGHVVVTSLQPRAHAFCRARTSVLGRVAENGIVPSTRRS
jgi:hypothetical protein